MPDLALFDFDGTLTTRETFPAFMRYAVARPRLLVGGVLLAPVVFGYRRGWVAGNPTRASIVQMGLRGVDAERLRARGAAFARDVLPGVLRPEAMARLAWHRQRGDRVVVVSGGLDVYLAPWCAGQGVELLCSVLAERRGRITGYAGPQSV
ncbi:MAG: haloacid dehalogenase-like hydrolase, partial [Pseudoxanthomonas sp.]|nr:haloacid dehalogenase-like hydrolase [Pseudoxanthomonas sp.]